MAGTFNLRVVTPEGQIFNDDVEFVVLPGEAGELGILPNHAPLIAGLHIGVMRYTKDNETKRLAISSGFVEVAENSVSVLADTAEQGELIDLNRAISAKERAEKRLSLRTPDVDVVRAEIALRKALARISAAENPGKHH